MIFFLQPAQEVKDIIGFFNVSLTTVFIPFFALRIYYYYAHGRPPVAEAQMKTHKIAHIAHVMLYINITLVLVTGVLMMDRPINVFHLFHIPAPLSNIGYIMFFKKFHMYACGTLGMLVLLHVMAVIKHQLNGHGVMRRMSLR